MELNYKKLGEGQPFIILHGLMGTLDNWMTMAKVLGETYTVYLVDQRNHGLSPKSDEFNYDVMAEDLNTFIDQHNIDNPIILGHSMGGKTAMTFATKHPDKFDKLIVVDIAPKSYPVHHHTILAGLSAIKIDEIKSRGEADRTLAEYVSDMGVRQFLLKNLDRTKEGGFQWKINLPVIKENIEVIGLGLPEVVASEKPTLFVRGAKSDYIVDSDENLMKTIFPNSNLITISNAGHWVHAEQPKALLDSINDFLN